MTENGARATGAPDPDEMVPTGAEAGPAAEEVADDQQALAKEAAEMRDRWMRALAEMENLRRRTEREVADARSYGISGFARDVLSVADNLRRALDALPAELRAGGDAAVKALVDGIDLTDRELAKALEKHGVRKVEAKGQKFDPNVHQAMFEVPDPSVPNGTVTQVVQDGYMIGERVLRPALVGVAKGGPKAPANDDKAAKQPEG